MLKLPIRPLALSATMALSLAVGAGQAKGESPDMNSGIVVKEVALESDNYCHIKYMAFTEQSLKAGHPEFNPYDIVDMYGPCNFDPKSPEEIQKQIALLPQFNGLRDGSGSGDSD